MTTTTMIGYAWHCVPMSIAWHIVRSKPDGRRSHSSLLDNTRVSDRRDTHTPANPPPLNITLTPLILFFSLAARYCTCQRRALALLVTVHGALGYGDRHGVAGTSRCFSRTHILVARGSRFPRRRFRCQVAVSCSEPSIHEFEKS